MIEVLQTAVIIIWGGTMIFMAREIGRLKERLNDQKRVLEVNATSDPQPVCGCKHHQCFHDETGCGHESNAYDHSGGGWGILTCGCKRYTGPEPLPQVIP